MMQAGSCHCGALRFRVEGSPTQAIECNCSHCGRKGLLLWFVPRGALHVDAGGNRLTEYRFNRHVIQHLFCAACGCQPFGLGTSPDGHAIAAINLRCLDDVDLAAIPRVPFDGRAM